MRIAYICADRGVPVLGRKGCSVHVQEIVRAFLACGARVHLFAASAGGRRPAGLEGVTLVQLPVLAGSDAASLDSAAVNANVGLDQALARHGRFDLVYERYSLWSFAGMEYARATGVPGVLEVNAPLIREQAQHRTLADRDGAERIAARVFAAASAILAVSDEIASELAQHPAARVRIHLVPNGVDPARFSAVNGSHTRRPTHFTVGFVGSLKAWHGLQVLAEAFGSLRASGAPIRLSVVGDGPERQNFEAALIRLGVRRAARFSGGVPHSAVPRLLRWMDATVAPYVDSSIYFSPLKVYESMAAGVPVVASRTGQLARLIEHEVNGLLCTPGEPASLAGALERLHREPSLARRLGRAAQATVRREHTWQHRVRDILTLAGLHPPAAGAASQTGDPS